MLLIDENLCTYFVVDMCIKIYDSKLASELAADLLEIGAIKLSPNEPFIWASGWKSPIYCDNRLSLSFPDVRAKIKTALSLVISKEFNGVDIIAGVATAGIPQGALVADELALPFAYVRSASKGHGLQNLIEGKVEKGQKILLIEDLVSTGGSSLAAAEALREVGGEVVGMVASFTYGFAVAERNFEKHKVDLVVLSDYEHLLDHAQEKRMFENKVLKTLKEWRRDPGSWEG